MARAPGAGPEGRACPERNEHNRPCGGFHFQWAKHEREATLDNVEALFAVVMSMRQRSLGAVELHDLECDARLGGRYPELSCHPQPWTPQPPQSSSTIVVADGVPMRHAAVPLESTLSENCM